MCIRDSDNLASHKGRYEATFILQEILGPRPETPLLDDIATPEQLQKLEEERKGKNEILEDWHTPPGSPWERSEDQTFDTTSLSWDTDDIQVPNSWDKGEEMTKESQTEETESEDSLPELVSDEADTSRESGYAFLDTRPSTKEEDAEAEGRDREEEKQKM